MPTAIPTAMPIAMPTAFHFVKGRPSAGFAAHASSPPLSVSHRAPLFLCASSLLPHCLCVVQAPPGSFADYTVLTPNGIGFAIACVYSAIFAKYAVPGSFTKWVAGSGAVLSAMGVVVATMEKAQARCWRGCVF